MDRIKKNIVRAKCITGIYKDRNIEVIIGESSLTTKVLVGGKDVTDTCLGVWIKIPADGISTIHLEFVSSKQAAKHLGDLHGRI